MVLSRRYSSERAPDKTTALSGALQILANWLFGSHYPDSDLRARTEADTMYGKPDREPYLMWAARRASEVFRSLVGHQLDTTRLPIGQQLERLLAGLSFLIAEAIAAVDVLELAEVAHAALTHRLYVEGIATPEREPWRRRIVIAIMIVIGFGEMILFTPSMAAIGLADTPLVAAVPFITAQLVGALSGVVALLVLGHSLGQDSQPKKLVGTWRTQLAMSSAGHRLTILGIGAVLVGMSTIRELYLNERGSGNVWAALGFAGLNIGMVMATRWLSLPDRRSYAVQFLASENKVAAADQKYQAKNAAVVAQVGEINALVIENEVVFSQHGHAADAGASDALRQIEGELPFYYRLAQPEPGEPEDGPVVDFATLPRPESHKVQDDVRAYLLNEQAMTAVTPYYPYVRQSLERLEQRWAKRQERRDAWVDARLTEIMAAASPTENDDENTADADTESAATGKHIPTQRNRTSGERDDARRFYDAKFGPEDRTPTSAVALILARQFGVPDATARKWVTEFRREDAAQRASTNGEGSVKP